MYLKQKWICVVLMLVLFPFSVQAQSSIYELSRNKTQFGIGLIRQEMGSITPRETTTITGNLDYGIDNNLKITFLAGVGLTDEPEVPPSPTGEMGLMHVKPFGDTGLDYYASGNISAAFFRVVKESTNQVSDRSRILNLSGEVGVFKRLQTEDGLEISPFFALSYERYWETSETNADFIQDGEVVLKRNTVYGDFGGNIGVEIELTPITNLLAGLSFSFERFGAAFRIGLNFR